MLTAPRVGAFVDITTDIIESDFSLPSTALGRDARKAFSHRPGMLCIALVEDGQPVGLISKSELLLRYADEWGAALYDRRPALLLADRAPLTVEADDPVSNLLSLAERGDSHQLLSGFVIVRDGRYAGVSSLLALLRATRAKADHLQFLYSELEAAHEMAVAADNAKTRFLATMSHELRTPLNAILGYAELIEEEYGESDNALRDDARKIGSAGRHLLSLIDEVLDYSKLESNGMRADPDWFDISSWAKDVVDVIRPLALQNNNSLRIDIEDNLPRAFSDQSRLRQCLFNLAGNACKFTQNGLVVITIFERDSMLHAKVSDTGIGMSAEQLDRLFKPFSQAESSISRRFGGTGLGLSITQKIANLLGGRVTVASAPGVGSTFELIVPMRLETNDALGFEKASSEAA